MHKITERSTTDEYEVGDLIVFNVDSSSHNVCHEIVGINEVNGVTTYTTKGSSNATIDRWKLTKENIFGEPFEIIMRNGEVVFLDIE